MSNSDAVTVLKMERLKRHLDEVEKLVERWRPELDAPRPFTASEGRLWPPHHRPVLEQDADNNHMLRRHIHSRAFWRHHSDWEKKLAAVYQKSASLAKTASDYMEQLLDKEPEIRPTISFLRTALEEAFALSIGTKTVPMYRPVPEGGVFYGNYQIEEAALPEEVGKVEKAHRNLVIKLNNLVDMEDIVRCWKDAKQHEGSMGKLLGDVLKSGDIFYSCRFCRKLLRV